MTMAPVLINGSTTVARDTTESARTILPARKTALVDDPLFVHSASTHARLTATTTSRNKTFASTTARRPAVGSRLISMLPLLLASLFFFGSPPLAVSAAQNSSPVATPANAGAAVAVDSTEALYNALLRASAGLAAGAGGGANASVALLAWTASLLRGTGVDQDVINARNSGLGALLVAPTNYAWQQFFDVLERANAKQPAATWPDIFVGYPSVTPAALVAAATSITTPSSASPPNITRTFSNLSAPLSLDALSTEGKAALRGVLLLHLTGAYYLESQLEAMAFPNGSDPAPQHGHIYAVGTNQTIQIHIESDKSLVFRVPANANTPVRDSPYTAYSVTAAATVLPALKDAIADGRLAVQGADHVLVPPTGPANAGGKVFNVNVQAVLSIAVFTMAFLLI